MAFKKTHFLIAAFIIFWILFIGWGMAKTSFKLFKGKSPVAALLSSKEKPAAETKTAEPAPQEAVEVEARPILVRTFRVKPANFQDMLPVMGTVKGKTEIELKFEINGVIKNINFREGEKIRQGELVACIDPADVQLKASYGKNKFKSAEAAYNSALKKLEVHRKLYEAGAIIKSKLEEVELETESAKYQVETARSEMELAENELNKTCLYAAKDGVMGPREAEEGEFVTPQDKVGSLLEISEVFVEVGVVERDINRIKLGQRAKIYVDAYPNATFEGNVEYIYPVVEGKSRTLTIKLKVPNPEGSLLPGMFSRAEIFIAELNNALIIPATALIHAGGGVTLAPVIPSEAIQIGEDESQTGVVQLRRIGLGYLTSDYAQAIEGLDEDDLVVIEAQGELKDNAKVKIVGVEEASF